MPRKRNSPPDWGDDLFSIAPEDFAKPDLSRQLWPAQARFPVNRPSARVRDVVAEDLLASESPVLIAGYSSIAALVDLVADWRRRRADKPGNVRLLLGSEPFASQRTHFMSPGEEFTQEVREYWLEQSISVLLSAKVIRVIAELDAGFLQVRVIPGPPRLHAKIYVGDSAATVGSSNYTDYGLARQFEANARFDRSGDRERYEELVKVADNFWSQATGWEEEFRRLLNALLQVVTWKEALARACAELLEGDWAQQALTHQESRAPLWPSQRSGIAQALWVVENLGSVLVADATGSGKTRMGAHLVAAVRDRLIDTGRLRRDRDLTTLVCPPAVLETWQREALKSGVTTMPVSHGILSRPDSDSQRVELEYVARAQVLAVDEAHNFLTADSKRTQHVRHSLADHVLLFTATPISRSAQDLLSLVGLLGADNFEDGTLEILEQLDRGARIDEALTTQQRNLLRKEIQRFTVRRTKSALNSLVDQDQDAYRHPESGRVCRYPAHEPRVYATGETPADEAVAEEIRHIAAGLRGVLQLGRKLYVPDLLRSEVTDQQWLDSRLKAARGLARYNILAAMRSSRAALIEHVAGTDTAIKACALPLTAKVQPSGDVLSKVALLAEQGPPKVLLTCALPTWLTDPPAWREACTQEEEAYRRILACASTISDARENAKADLLACLATEHRLVLAFDRHPITLAAVKVRIPGPGAEVLIATGETPGSRRRVEELFARDSQEHAIALCSDALNEGLNLQGAAALVHLDLPTTLRAAEQRVGRVDRMDSPHDQITVWWPEDGKAFATREVELLLSRRHASESLLGSNLPMPAFADHEDSTVIPVQQHISDLDRSDLTWDGISDALDPVRSLIHGTDALIPPAVYAEHRNTRHRVMARVAPVASDQPWAFLALAGTKHGAPRWLVLEGTPPQATVGVEAVTERLRHHLRNDPPDVAFDENCEHWLGHFLTAAAREETLLLPRRMQRALEQMAQTTLTWSHQALGQGHYDDADQWRRLSRIARPDHADEERPDPYLVGEAWWDLVRPLFAETRLPRRRRRRYIRLRDLDQYLKANPLDLSTVYNALRRVPIIEPVDKRISAAIIGIPQ